VALLDFQSEELSFLSLRYLLEAVRAFFFFLSWGAVFTGSCSFDVSEAEFSLPQMSFG